MGMGRRAAEVSVSQYGNYTMELYGGRSGQMRCAYRRSISTPLFYLSHFPLVLDSYYLLVQREIRCRLVISMMLAIRAAARFCSRTARVSAARAPRPTRCYHDFGQSKFLKVSDEIRDAVATGKPVVALESTIYTHGMCI